MAKNKLADFIAIVKILNIGFIKKHIPNLGIGGGGGHSVLRNYQSLASKFFLLVSFLPNYFSR